MPASTVTVLGSARGAVNRPAAIGITVGFCTLWLLVGEKLFVQSEWMAFFDYTKDVSLEYNPACTGQPEKIIAYIPLQL